MVSEILFEKVKEMVPRSATSLRKLEHCTFTCSANKYLCPYCIPGIGLCSEAIAANKTNVILLFWSLCPM